MANKKSFVLRIDEEVYRALEKWAVDEFRSVNGQIEWLISQELKKNGRVKDAKGDMQTKKGKQRNDGLDEDKEKK